ncbi:MAG: response regulator [Magnetococcales bacterium]|nr:response regulator [Magnetococcales bacterium]
MPTILVIEDDPQVRQLVKEALTPLGTVITAPDGQVGHEIIHHHRGIDLLITDILMPNREGLSVVRDLRKWDPHVKIMVITGGDRVFPADILVDVAKISGADVTLKKPFSIEKLRTEVTRLLDERLKELAGKG